MRNICKRRSLHYYPDFFLECCGVKVLKKSSKKTTSNRDLYTTMIIIIFLKIYEIFLKTRIINE